MSLQSLELLAWYICHTETSATFGSFCCCFHQHETSLKANQFCDVYKWFLFLACLPDSSSSVYSPKVSIGHFYKSALALRIIAVIVLGSRCTLWTYAQLFMYNVAIIHLIDACATFNSGSHFCTLKNVFFYCTVQWKVWIFSIANMLVTEFLRIPLKILLYL